jgi:phosphohistidine phosphatase
LELHFLRHGLAGDPAQWQGDDAVRPLTEEGRSQLVRVAAGLAALGLVPDLILASPLLRAAQTAEVVAGALGIAERVVTEDRLAPGFGRKQLRGILADHAGHRSLMLVGHEPDFSKTVGKLIGGAHVAVAKGGLASVDVPDVESLKCTLLRLAPPEMLERAAK